MDRKKAKRQAEELVAKMTVEERASQLRYDAPAIERLGIPEYNWWNEGLHGVARAGTATSYPQAIALAACFDPERLETMADQIATEGRAKYNAFSSLNDRDIYKGLTFWSPNVNIFRDPRWGRGQETYGEDPFLTKQLGKAFVKGLQGNGTYMKAAACAKHFAAHSGPEELRHQFDARVSPKDLEETYLPAFEELVREAGVEAVMGAYNRTNGEPCCASNYLISETLRGKWKFEGHYVSDCWAIRDFHEHHLVTEGPTQSAAMALNNGCDLNCGCTYIWIMKALEEGLISEEAITRAAVRLFTTRFLLGLMSDDCEYDNIPYTMVEHAQHLALSEKLAEESIVLLKNDGILPLNRDKIKNIAVIGPNADSRRALIGNYHGTASEYITVLEGIRRVCGPDARIFYSQGADQVLDRVEPLSGYEGDRISEALIAASCSDAVILVLGLDETLEGEEGDTGNAYSSGDKADLLLPASQRKLLEAVAKTGKPVIVCNMSGSAIDLSFAQDHCNAVLQVWYPGARGGLALGRILFGDVSPSGKLPVTFYYNDSLEESLPPFEDYSMQGRTYRYMTGEALYPFGYGLTYSDVKVRGLRGETTGSFCSEDTNADAALNVRLQIDVENCGNTATDEVLQIYVKNSTSEWAQENWHLCGFLRISTLPGQMQTVNVTIPQKELCVVNDAGERIMDGNLYRFYAGTHQPDERSCALSGSDCAALDLVL